MRSGNKTGKTKAAASRRRPSAASAQKGNRPAQPRPGLTRESITQAAMAIIDREGFEGLSMRKLGKELGVNPMAVYYHIPNKSELLDALVEVVMNEIDLSVDDPSFPVEERLVAGARVYRDAILAHPSLIQAVVSRPPRTAAGLRPVEALLGIFRDAGFRPEDATISVNIFATYVRGAVVRIASYPQLDMRENGASETDDVFDFAQVVEQLDPREFPNMLSSTGKTGYFSFEEEFDRGVRALIRGLLQMYGKQRED